MAMLLITHDLGVVAETAQRIGVMYAGQIVETAPAERFFANPCHPYSRKLFASLPGAPGAGGRSPSSAERAVACARFTGCRFAARCDQRGSVCRTERP